MSSNKDSIRNIHRDIMRRCYDERYKLYKDYGAIGRKVCEEWHDRDNFRLWAQHNGFEQGLRLLRRDTKGDFCPDNCFWGVSPTKSYEYGKIKAHKAEVKARKDEFVTLIGNVSPSNHLLSEVYHGMKTRCYNPNGNHYKYYGERGIKICDEWLGKDGLYNFIRWAIIEGGYEKGLTIDRIDVDGDYCPENCRWVTMKIQGRNKRKVHQFLVNGELHSAMSYCEMFGYPYSRFMSMMKKGMTMNQILDALEK